MSTKSVSSMSGHSRLWITVFEIIWMAYFVSGSYRIVCYFNSAASDRQGDGHFTVENIDPYMCTHLVYVAATFDGIANVYMNKSKDERDPTVVGFVQLKQKNPHLKTMASMGSWLDSDNAIFDKNLHNFDKFAQSASIFLDYYGLDGLDISWPWQGATSLPNKKDRRGFIELLNHLRNAFKFNNYVLSITVSPDPTIADRSYDISTINSAVDFINLKSFNMTGGWNSTADHHAPLCHRLNNEKMTTVDSVVSYWLNKGLSAAKINVGIPFFGNSWKMSSTARIPPASASGPGPAGEFTKTKGVLAYYEICRNIFNQKFEVNQYSRHCHGPIARSRDEKIAHNWVSYDDISMVRLKAKYILKRNLGGAVVWDVSMDDFRNLCRNGNNPLLTNIYRTLNSIGNLTDSLDNFLRIKSGAHQSSFTANNLLLITHLIFKVFI